MRKSPNKSQKEIANVQKNNENYLLKDYRGLGKTFYTLLKDFIYTKKILKLLRKIKREKTMNINNLNINKRLILTGKVTL